MKKNPFNAEQKVFAKMRIFAWAQKNYFTRLAKWKQLHLMNCALWNAKIYIKLYALPSGEKTIFIPMYPVSHVPWVTNERVNTKNILLENPKIYCAYLKNVCLKMHERLTWDHADEIYSIARILFYCHFSSIFPMRLNIYLILFMLFM